MGRGPNHAEIRLSFILVFSARKAEISNAANSSLCLVMVKSNLCILPREIIFHLTSQRPTFFVDLFTYYFMQFISTSLNDTGTDCIRQVKLATFGLAA